MDSSALLFTINKYKSPTDLRTRVSWCQMHLWTSFCLNNMLVMVKLYIAQESNNCTHLSSDQAGHFSQSSLQVQFLEAMCSQYQDHKCLLWSVSTTNKTKTKYTKCTVKKHKHKNINIKMSSSGQKQSLRRSYLIRTRANSEMASLQSCDLTVTFVDIFNSNLSLQ